MANILKTRILQKYDSYAAWNSSAIELKKGEIAFAVIDNLTTDAHGKIVNVPTVVMKVGNGKTGDEAKFANLPYVSALAADVYSWAKQDAATFINNFLAMNNGSVENPVTMQSVLDGVFATDAELAAAVQSLQGELTTALANYYTKNEIDGMFTTLRGEIADLDVGAIEGRVDDLETAVETTLPGLINGVDAKFADYTKTSELDAKVDDLGYAKVSELPTKVSELENDAAYLVAADIAGKADAEQVAKDIAAAVAPLATTEALNALAGTHATDKAALEGAIEDNADAIEALAGEHATDKAALEAAIALKADKSVVEAMYTNAQIDELLAAKQDTIPAETYDAFGSAAAAETAAKSYADQKLLDFENAYIKADENGTIDKLNEIASWIADDEAGAAKIISDVAKANETAGNAVATANTAAADAATAKSDAATAVKTANEAKAAATDAQTGAAASAAAAKAAQDKAEAAQSAAEAARDEAVAAKKAALDANTSATAIANEAKETANGAKTAADAATEAVAGLHNIAKTGNVNDLVQTEGDVIIFDCGDATHVI